MLKSEHDHDAELCTHSRHWFYYVRYILMRRFYQRPPIGMLGVRPFGKLLLTLFKKRVDPDPSLYTDLFIV